MDDARTSPSAMPAFPGLQLRIETPENVVLNYQLAGPAARLNAYLIDFGLRIAIFCGLSMVLMPLMTVFPGSGMGLMFVSMFVVEWGYFAISEGCFKGKTVGKHAMGLRVIHELGYPITFWPAVLRNLIRAADGFPFSSYGVGFGSTLLSRNFQRLGDLAARTVVITERNVGFPTEPLILERIQPLSREELGALPPSTDVLTAIDQFLGRRFVLSHDRGHEIASILARDLAEKLGYRGDSSLVRRYPMAFLARVYVTFLRRREDDETLTDDEAQFAAAAGVVP